MLVTSFIYNSLMQFTFAQEITELALVPQHWWALTAILCNYVQEFVSHPLALLPLVVATIHQFSVFLIMKTMNMKHMAHGW